jgi:hypothetical protein
VKTLGLTIAIPLALFACSNDFAPYSELDRLRILAIRSEPAMPLPGESATLSALTFAPAGQIPAYHWSWCPVVPPASSNYSCPMDQATADQIFAGSLEPGIALPSLDLGQGLTADFTNPFALASLSDLCTNGFSSPGFSQGLTCEQGYPVLVVLDVSVTGASLRAGFVVWLPASMPPVINQNPSLSALSLDSIGLETPQNSIGFLPGQKVIVQVQINPAEVRPIPPSEGPPGQRLEHMWASWFADAGRIDKTRTAYIDDVAPLDQTSQNTWTAPTAEEWPSDNLFHFAVVLRDDRGGASWVINQTLIGQTP